MLQFNTSFFTASAQVNSQDLSKEVLERSSRVPEFQFIQRLARKKGLKVYLFGGTASAFAHYVRWDLERENGDSKYQSTRFDYDYTNIYRGNQDLDIVIDGSAEEARAFQKVLHKEYPHFVGDKTNWEVRTLREPIGDKEALLDSFEFQNQHTDSNSIGLIDLTSEASDVVFKDLLDWNNKSSAFLNDIASGQIQYIFRENHKKTKRYKKGLNPAALSAIRYLAKLAQYQVHGTKQDLEVVNKIIAQTDFNKLSDYAKKKVGSFGLKALLNSPNVEFAWNLLEQTGVRKKLIEMDGKKINEYESLSWWMSKEPLRSSQVGLGTKQTAIEIAKNKKLDKLIVSHETRSFNVYENITRSVNGDANVFISRTKTIGESAAFGKGFYTKIGSSGAIGSNLTVRFEIDPNARQGTDFIYDKSSEFIIIKNKKILKLIPDNLNLTLPQFFTLLLKGDIKSNDKGLLEKFLRKFKRSQLDTKEISKTATLFSSQPITSGLIPAIEAWKSFSWSKNYPNVLQGVGKNIELTNLESIDENVIKYLLQNESSSFNRNPALRSLAKILIKEEYDSSYDRIYSEWFNSPGTLDFPEVVDHLASWREAERKNPQGQNRYYVGLDILSKKWKKVKAEWLMGFPDSAVSSGKASQYFRENTKIEGDFLRTLLKLPVPEQLLSRLEASVQDIDIPNLFDSIEAISNKYIEDDSSFDRKRFSYERHIEILSLVSLVRMYAKLDSSHDLETLNALDVILADRIKSFYWSLDDLGTGEDAHPAKEQIKYKLEKVISAEFNENGNYLDEYALIKELNNFKKRANPSLQKSFLKSSLFTFISISLTGAALFTPGTFKIFALFPGMATLEGAVFTSSIANEYLRRNSVVRKIKYSLKKRAKTKPTMNLPQALSCKSLI